ncbi:hypothetical protein TNCV_1134041 [Trichonephila clavipes]|nr:hypothetical protein TNCV_1134041 [Trichonephila clavipes]
MIIGDRHRSILADHLLPVLQTPFPGERHVFQDDNAPVYMLLCVQTEQSPCSVSSFTHTIWTRDDPAREMSKRERILMNFAQDLYLGFPRRMKAVFQAKSDPSPYQ